MLQDSQRDESIWRFNVKRADLNESLLQEYHCKHFVHKPPAHRVCGLSSYVGDRIAMCIQVMGLYDGKGFSIMLKALLQDFLIDIEIDLRLEP